MKNIATNEQLVIQIKAGINASDNMLQLWQQNQGYIAKISTRFKGYEDIDDLKQQGYLGLHDAVDHYEPDQGIPFINYAGYWIRQSIQRYIENCGAVVRIPIHTHTAIQKYKRFCTMFEQQYNRKPDNRETSGYMKMSLRQVEQLQKDVSIFNVGSLDEPLNTQDGNLFVGDSVASTEDLEGEAVDRVANEQLYSDLWGVVDALEKEPAAAIRYRFKENRTLKETGEVMGITPEAVRQWQSKGLRKLRCDRKIRQIGADYIDTHAYGGGIDSFNRTWTSSTEYTALGLMEL